MKKFIVLLAFVASVSVFSACTDENVEPKTDSKIPPVVPPGQL